jgi:hypothetical protein
VQSLRAQSSSSSSSVDIPIHSRISSDVDEGENDDARAGECSVASPDARAWELLSSALEKWIDEFVSELGLSRYQDMPDAASWWNAKGELTGTLDAWSSSSDDGDDHGGKMVEWAVRYATTSMTSDGTFGRRSLGFNVWLGSVVDAPHLTVYVSVNGNGAATLMADHLPRVDLAVCTEYARRYYGGERAAYWSMVRGRSGIRPFVSMDPAVRAIQGPNALALRADFSPYCNGDGNGNDDDGGPTTLVEALNDHCSAWLDHVRNATALNPEERGSVIERDMAMRTCLRDHERDAGKRVMDSDFATFLADCMAGFGR